ncbi:3-hydroxyacyl- dehyrogenase [Pyrenophora seminiperda CCB06]|uniref:3-hydroxyacyl-dehyrogenase n=1 Tax=Pyrenophora seminiperda CCB06 TaxID=1302712 RepID=A0A3M7M2N9_9PLEO|nr:3-hydroxyacyl- dehyrogenase [Pyrenophora seminiperda CCB06]
MFQISSTTTLTRSASSSAEPQWSPPDTSSRPIAVLGGGVLGRRIACSWVAAGYKVVLCDINEEQRNAATHYVEHHVDEYAKLSGKQRNETRFSTVSYIKDAVKDAWMVVEALPEKLPLKIDVMAQLEQQTPKDCILASNSSSYKSRFMLDKVDAGSRHRVCNMHYYMPPGNNVVELMTCGETHSDILPFLQDKLQDAGMLPAIARKESTGFIFNRLWAAIKRESLLILAEGVSEPKEIDKLFLTMFKNNPLGPCGMMDAVGLDTVAFIESNYVQERGIDSTARDWVQKNFVEKGKLGAKSGKGGLYPAGETTRGSKAESGHHGNLAAPRLYFLDIGIGGNVTDLKNVVTSGKIMTASADGSNVRELVGGQAMPDGIDVSMSAGRIFWTNMGTSPASNNGSVMSAKLDGTDVQAIIPEGQIHTPKQLKIDHDNKKLYICDREGLRVHRCDFDGKNHELILQTGEMGTQDVDDQTKWCVGIAVDPQAGMFYWSQKGPSKGGKGRIFRANMKMPDGETASSRSDTTLLFDNLPEPIDLEYEPESQTLYWTDRGEYPLGNTLNKAYVGSGEAEKNEIVTLARHFHEAIGLKIDAVNRHVYTTDLGGTVYRFDMDGGKKEKIYQTDSAYSGIALAHLQHSVANLRWPFRGFSILLLTSTTTMNTISQPPRIKRISGPKRFFGVLLGITGGLGANALIAYGVTSFYTRNTKFVPFDTSSPDLSTAVFRAHNPHGNPPACIDHAIKQVPYGKLPQKYWIKSSGDGITVDQRALTTDFCRSVWSGVAFRVQRRIMERKYRNLEGRDKHLWDVKELAKNEYPVGTGIVDHFEVVQHTDDKVIVRCGDSPFIAEHRPSDGLFSMEVSKDDEAQVATFHLKSVFVDTTPEGKNSEPQPGPLQAAHRLYTKLWMESATRKMIKEA